MKSTQQNKDLQKLNLPPNAVAVEQKVLWILLNSPGMVAEVMSHIPNAEIFFTQKNRDIFEAIQNIFKIGANIDLVSVFQELRKLNSADIAYLQSVNEGVYSDNIFHELLILKELWIRRVLIVQAVNIQRLSNDLNVDVFETLAKTQNVLMRTIDFMSAKKASSIQAIFNNVLTQSLDAEKIYTGITGIDKMLSGGFGKGEVIILAARPSMGKTAVAAQIAVNSALMFNKKVLFFSLETTENKIGSRILSNISLVPNHIIKNKSFSDQDLEKIRQALRVTNEISLNIDDEFGLDIAMLRSKALARKSKEGLDFIVIDYLQLMQADEKKIREQQISEISRGLKKLAKELDIPILALAQLSRDVEKRGGNKKPMLSDLRESGSIEQDADVVMFLYRAEQYGIKENEEGESTAGKLEIIFAKNKEGNVGYIETGIDFTTNSVYDLQEDSYATIAQETVELPSRPNVFNQVQSEFEFQNDNSKQETPPF